MARQIKVGSYVKVINDQNDDTDLGKKGVVTYRDGDYVSVLLDDRKTPLPFSLNELAPANRKRNT